jgi:hypothetical protein
VDLVQIQQEERWRLTVKSSGVEVLIKGEYAVKRGRAIATCQRGRMRSACTKRIIETKKKFTVRGMVRIECEEKAKGKEEYLVKHEVDEISL